MRSDSLFKTTACVLSFSLLLGTCAMPINADAKSVEVNEPMAMAGFQLAITNSDVVVNIEEQEYTDVIGKTNYASAVVEKTDSKESDTVESKETETKEQKEAAKEDNKETIKEDKKNDTKEEKAADKETETKAEKQEVVSKYANVGISVANSYVNIREKASADSEVEGKLYRGSAATILEKNGEWAKIKSGKVVGYINLEYLAIGNEAEKLVDTYATKYATIKTVTLNVREKADKGSRVLTQIPQDDSYEVMKEYDEWVYISIEEDIKGYVSKDYVEITEEFEHAVSIEEERAAQEAARQAEEEAAAEAERQAAEERQAASSSSSSKSSSKKSSTSSSTKKSSTSSSSSKKTTASSSSSTTSSSSSSSGQKVVDYALQFVGNPYVYGGTSLTKGADCSGFVQSIYKHFGYSLGRTSRDQYASAGTIVSTSSLKPGDLLFYGSSGYVNHVAIYIGNGKIVHASNARTGIKISPYNYRAPMRARRVIN